MRNLGCGTQPARSYSAVSLGRDRIGCPSCSIPFPAGSSWAQLQEDGAGWIHPWGKTGSSEQLRVPPARP